MNSCPLFYNEIREKSRALEKFKKSLSKAVVVTAIELLSGIPSVVFGLLGMQVLVPAVAKVFGKASGACLLSAIVVLSIMII